MSDAPRKAAGHRWSFVRFGGVDQVVFRSGADIAHLGELDQTLWAALACPTRGLEFDARTLELIDTDHDSRIRAPELVGAARWACARLGDADLLLQGGDSLPIAAIATHDAEGCALLAEAREVLGLLGRPDDTRIALADVTDRARLLDALRFDGDGIVTPDATNDTALQSALRLAMQTQGAMPDRRGRDGINRARTEALLAQVDAVQTWYLELDQDTVGAPLGRNTADALALVESLQPQVEDYFTRSRLAAYNPPQAAALNTAEAAMQALALAPLSSTSAALEHLPLAAVGHGADLPLSEGVNPFWADALQRLRTVVAEPLLGQPVPRLSEAQWRELRRRLAGATAWFVRRPANPVATLPAERVTALAALDMRNALLLLFDEEDAAARRHGRIADLEKLLRLQRDLLTLLNNFVSFSAFYHRQGAIFQAGTLYLDARRCDLSVRVDDPARHAVLAGMAKTYLAYCDCRREGDKMAIVSAFTAGDVDFLFVGRNGIFYDREGRDWDATITKVIENPTSVGQAFFSPYKKFLRALEEQAAKRAAASDAQAQGGLGGLAARVAGTAANTSAPATTPAAAPAAVTAPLSGVGGRRFDVGTVAALGVAFGSLSAVAVGVFAKFVDLGWWIPVALLGIFCAISGPSMLIAWLKLRQRSLGPLLDACGWAVNGRLRINVRLGATLSRTARMPPNAGRQLRDPYAEQHGLAWALGSAAVLIAALLVLWRYGTFNADVPAALRVPVSAAARPASAAPAAATAPAPAPATSAVPPR